MSSVNIFIKVCSTGSVVKVMGVKGKVVQMLYEAVLLPSFTKNVPLKKMFYRLAFSK